MFTRNGQRHYGPGDTIPDYRLDPPEVGEVGEDIDGWEDMSEADRQAYLDEADEARADAAIEAFISERDAW